MTDFDVNEALRTKTAITHNGLTVIKLRSAIIPGSGCRGAPETLLFGIILGTGSPIWWVESNNYGGLKNK